jgi:hypothetical protein
LVRASEDERATAEKVGNSSAELGDEPDGGEGEDDTVDDAEDDGEPEGQVKPALVGADGGGGEGEEHQRKDDVFHGHREAWPRAPRVVRLWPGVHFFGRSVVVARGDRAVRHFGYMAASVAVRSVTGCQICVRDLERDCPDWGGKWGPKENREIRERADPR